MWVVQLLLRMMQSYASTGQVLLQLCRRGIEAGCYHNGLIMNLVYFNNPEVVAKLGCPVGGVEDWLNLSTTLNLAHCTCCSCWHASI